MLSQCCLLLLLPELLAEGSRCVAWVYGGGIGDWYGRQFGCKMSPWLKTALSLRGANTVNTQLFRDCSEINSGIKHSQWLPHSQMVCLEQMLQF